LCIYFQFSQFLAALQSYLQIILESLPADDNVTAGMNNQQAARLQELVEFIQSQVYFLLNPSFVILFTKCSCCIVFEHFSVTYCEGSSVQQFSTHNTCLPVFSLHFAYLRDRVRNDNIRERLGMTLVDEKFVQHRLRWFGHIQ
jgi:hypothetical protein